MMTLHVSDVYPSVVSPAPSIEASVYYRTDIFSDPKLQQAYQAKFNRPLSVPQTWDDYSQTAQFITDQLAPNVYGAAHFRKAGSPGNQFGFAQEFRANGGLFFDQSTMKAGLDSPAGLTTLNQSSGHGGSPWFLRKRTGSGGSYFGRLRARSDA